MRIKRPLRSVFVGDLNYVSAYRFGVHQGMTLLGHWHRNISIRAAPEIIQRMVEEMKPDLVFTHMLMWPPARGAPPAEALLELAWSWRRAGAVVLIHDGDPRDYTRHPYSVADAVDAALLNHRRPSPEWGVRSIYWPYAAFVQKEIGEPIDWFRCDVAFAGLMREDEGLYGERTRVVEELGKRVNLKVFPGPDGTNNRMQIADLAPSATSMVGFGRPSRPGWVDTRVFSVPGAGGVLIHDDAPFLEPGTHFIPAKLYDVDSIVAAVEVAKAQGAAIRKAAFQYVQAYHTWVHRCEQVLDLFFA